MKSPNWRLWMREHQEDYRRGLLVEASQLAEATLHHFSPLPQGEQRAIYAAAHEIAQAARPTLQELRIRVGYSSQASFGAACGVSESTIFEAEGGRPISLRSALKVLPHLQTHRGMEALDLYSIAWAIRGLSQRRSIPTLADLRNRTGLTIRQVGPLVGLRFETVGEAERGIRVHHDTVVRLLTFYNARLGTEFSLDQIEANYSMRGVTGLVGVEGRT